MPLPRHPRGRAVRLGLGGPGLTRGLVVGYLSLMVLIPIAAVAATSLEGGIGAFWDAVTAPQARRRAEADRDRVADRRRDQRRLRDDRSPGSWSATSSPASASSTRSIDLPFALPTIVAGLTLLALYGENGVLGLSGVSFTRIGVVMALLFVTLPFVIRSVQPVLIELDADMEEAAASLGAGPLTIFRRVILPNLRSGDPRRRARSPSPARSASSARWS